MSARSGKKGGAVESGPSEQARPLSDQDALNSAHVVVVVFSGGLFESVSLSPKLYYVTVLSKYLIGLRFDFWGIGKHACVVFCLFVYLFISFLSPSYRLRQSVEVKDASVDDLQSKLSSAERERARLVRWGAFSGLRNAPKKKH